MIQVVLNDEQVQTVQNAAGAVELRDSQGRLVGYVSRSPSDEEIVEAKRRLNSAGPWHTTTQVLDHLQSLSQS